MKFGQLTVTYRLMKQFTDAIEAEEKSIPGLIDRFEDMEMAETHPLTMLTRELSVQLVKEITTLTRS